MALVLREEGDITFVRDKISEVITMVSSAIHRLEEDHPDKADFTSKLARSLADLEAAKTCFDVDSVEVMDSRSFELVFSGLKITALRLKDSDWSDRFCQAAQARINTILELQGPDEGNERAQLFRLDTAG